ncbi:attacin-A-like [Spodoptera litura]|uniref:Attacin-A-like n=1 Tax=Spodoptera litura TaxID=69820 RepID=A0A9J7EF28_SPOLT|nr:attacin-A-like [Spodoptera litura]
MFAMKLVLAAVLVVTSARHVPQVQSTYEPVYLLRFDDNAAVPEHEDHLPNEQLHLLGFEEDGRPVFELDDLLPEPEENYQPEHLTRTRRQAQGSVTLNSDGGMGLGAKIPLAHNDKNVVSAIGSMDFNNKMQPASKGFGLALDNVNGHGLTVMKENIPGFGDRLSGAGKLNVFHNDNHNVAVTGSLTRNMPSIPNVPNFNTVGGGVDYMYKNKVGASLGMASTPFLDRKDYSAMGNLNLFRSPTTTVDFSGGLKKFETPFMNSGWKPNFVFSLGRSF